jgi:hypothetical protein
MPVQQSKESEKYVSNHSKNLNLCSRATYDNRNHSCQALPPSEECGHDEDENRHRDGSYRQGELRFVSLHNNHKLHGKSKEEKKVEFEKGDVDLKGQIPSLHAEVGRNVLVDGPCKFVVQLPRRNREEASTNSQNNGYGNEKWLRLAPNCKVDIGGPCQDYNRLVNLLHLHGAVDEKTNIIHAQTDDLNSILETQSVPNEDKLVEETKYVKGEEGRDSARRGLILRTLFGVDLKGRKHISEAGVNAKDPLKCRADEITLQVSGLRLLVQSQSTRMSSSMVNWVGTCRKTCSEEAHGPDILLVGGSRQWVHTMDLPGLRGGKLSPRDRIFPSAPARSVKPRQ